MNREDLQPDLTAPKSIKEMVEESLAYTSVDSKTSNPLAAESMDSLLQKVYGHIEEEALKCYKSNAPWALRRWALEHILKDEIVDEATVDIADGLLQPVIEWQKEQPLDPLAHFQHRLTHTLRRALATVSVYMSSASRFVGMIGRKTDYTDDDVLKYLDWAGEYYGQSSSYVSECQRILQFLRNLPGANRNRMLPIPMPAMPDTFNQPMFSDEEVEIIAWATVLDKIRPDMVVRIAVASIYGGRVGELAQLSSDDIYLDGDKSYIYIQTEKRGIKKKQPIPPSLVPLFSVPIKPTIKPTLHNRLKHVVYRASVTWRHRMGFHSFRRNVVTTLDSMGTQSDIAIHKFMRWSTPRHLGMLDRYRRTPTEESDAKILSQHPRVKLWEEIIPYLLEFNPYYRAQSHIHNLT